MTDVTLPDTVVDLVAAAGAGVTPAAGGGTEVGDSEVRFLVLCASGTYTVERVQRGVRERVVLRTSEPAAVWRFLVLTFGSELRSREGRPALRLAPDGAPLPPGHAIEKTGPRRFRLRWEDGGRPCEADELIEVDAVDLAWAVTSTLPDLVESFRAPDGTAPGGPGPRNAR